MATGNARPSAPPADAVTRLVAIAICKSVYANGACACELTPHIPMCATMVSAAIRASDVLAENDPTR